MADLKLTNVAKTYGGTVNVLKDINLDIKQGELIVFVGPSGCGKSTLLRMIAGLEKITGGELKIDGQVVNDVPPAQRGIAMVFQSYALYPHMTVRDNMSFAMKLAKKPKEEIDAAIENAARILQLDEYLDRLPKALSGGQRQAVAIARAVYFNARILIMDEPTAALGVHETAMVADLIKELKAQGLGIFLISHDTREMMELCDRVSVMKNGHLIGTERVEDVTEDDVLSMIIMGKKPGETVDA